MSEEIKNYGKSIRARLLNVAKQESIFFQTILTRYFQERLLYRISQTHYKNNFYLKADQSSRMKDYYDLHQILSASQYDAEVLRVAIKRTFENRHTEYKDDVMFFRAEYPENAAMQIRWKSFVRNSP